MAANRMTLIHLLLIHSSLCILHTHGSRVRSKRPNQSAVVDASHFPDGHKHVYLQERSSHVGEQDKVKPQSATNKFTAKKLRKIHGGSVANSTISDMLKKANDAGPWLPPTLQLPLVLLSSFFGSSSKSNASPAKPKLAHGPFSKQTETPRTAVGTFSSKQADSDNEERLAGALKMSEADKHDHSLLMDIGGGIGAATDVLSQPGQKDLLRRVRLQDQGLLVILALVYVCAIGFGASVIYWRGMNRSSVTYYCYPAVRGDGVMSGHDTTNFLETFNQVPMASLEISGFEVVPPRYREFRWEGKNLRTAFSWSFDLSPWLAHDVLAETGNRVQGCAEGIYPEDILKLEKFLSQDDNDLASVEITKDLSWTGWEELATNIKHHIRQQGFTGVVRVQPSASEVVTVQKNTPWANFMHARAFFALCLASVFGLLFYWPYTWVRSTKVTMRSYHHVNIPIAEYWPLIEDKLRAHIQGGGHTR